MRKLIRIFLCFVGIILNVHADSVKKISSDMHAKSNIRHVGNSRLRELLRYKALLLASFEKDPEDSRTTFYLALTCEDLEEFEEAYMYYSIRCRQSGWFEETYESFYRLGNITGHLSKTNPKYTRQQAEEYYFAAHGLMPHRAEPLVKLAEQYWPDGEGPKNAALCYLYAKRAYELPYPDPDTFFINPEAYHFKRYELLSKAAWYVGDFALGEICSRKALAHSERPYLLRNLAYYSAALASQADAAG